MSDSSPEWADAEVVGACAPDLVRLCEWPGCRAPAVFEVEFDDDGEWLARRLCREHGAAVGVSE